MGIQDDIELLNSGEPIRADFVPHTNGEPPYFRAEVPKLLADAVLADAVAGGGKPFPKNGLLESKAPPADGKAWVTMATVASYNEELTPADMNGQKGEYTTERVINPTQVSEEDISGQSPAYVTRLQEQGTAAAAARILEYGPAGTKEDFQEHVGVDAPPELPAKAYTLENSHTEQGIIAAVQVVHEIASNPDSRDDAAYQASQALFRNVKGPSADNRYEVLHELRQTLGRAATKGSLATATSTFLENHADKTDNSLTVGDLGYASGIMLEGYIGSPQNGFVQGMADDKMVAIANKLANKTVLPENSDMRDIVKDMKTSDPSIVLSAAREVSDIATEIPRAMRC